MDRVSCKGPISFTFLIDFISFPGNSYIAVAKNEIFWGCYDFETIKKRRTK